MKLYKDTLKIFIKNKLFLMVTVLSYLGAVIYATKYYGTNLDLQMIVTPLIRGLQLSFYVFLVVLFCLMNSLLVFSTMELEKWQLRQKMVVKRNI